MALRDVSEVETVAGDFNEGLDHPEGVTWGPDGQLYAGGTYADVERIQRRRGRRSHRRQPTRSGDATRSGSAHIDS